MELSHSHQKIIIANWKSHKTAVEARQWLTQLVIPDEPAQTSLQVVVAPALTTLATVFNLLPSNVVLGAQTVSPFPLGAYTGAVTASQLKDLGTHYCLVGHSERRRYFHENDAAVAAQAAQLLEAGIIPVVCVDRPYLRSQTALLSQSALEKSVFAYEPLEAIGSGQNAAADDVAAVAADLRQLGCEHVIYGGSVTEQNIGEYLLVADGALVGSASLNVDQFNQILVAAAGGVTSKT